MELPNAFCHIHLRQFRIQFWRRPMVLWSFTINVTASASGRIVAPNGNNTQRERPVETLHGPLGFGDCRAGRPVASPGWLGWCIDLAERRFGGRSREMVLRL